MLGVVEVQGYRHGLRDALGLGMRPLREYPPFHGPVCGGKAEQHSFVQIRKGVEFFLTWQKGEGGSATRKQGQQQCFPSALDGQKHINSQTTGCVAQRQSPSLCPSFTLIQLGVPS